MVQLRDVTVCALRFRFSLGLTWCQPLTGKVFILEHTTSRFGAGMLLPG